MYTQNTIYLKLEVNYYIVNIYNTQAHLLSTFFTSFDLLLMSSSNGAVYLTIM